MIQIDIQRTGFPVKIGDVELWFDSSIENLRKFFNVDELAKKKLEQVQERANNIQFPEKVDFETIKNLDPETVDTALDLNKEFIAAQYDIIFGDGTFKKLYAKYPDIIALEKALDIVGVAIAQKIEEQEEERKKEVEKKKSEYLNKKKQKRK